MQKLSLNIIDLYKISVSPIFFLGVCKYQVSCSEYTKQRIKEFGVIQGSFLGLKRIWSCK